MMRWKTLLGRAGPRLLKRWARGPATSPGCMTYYCVVLPWYGNLFGVGREQVEDPPDIETMDDEVLLLAWKDKTLLELNELVRSLWSSRLVCSLLLQTHEPACLPARQNSSPHACLCPLFAWQDELDKGIKAESAAASAAAAAAAVHT